MRTWLLVVGAFVGCEHGEDGPKDGPTCPAPSRLWTLDGGSYRGSTSFADNGTIAFLVNTDQAASMWFVDPNGTVRGKAMGDTRDVTSIMFGIDNSGAITAAGFRHATDASSLLTHYKPDGTDDWQQARPASRIAVGASGVIAFNDFNWIRMIEPDGTDRWVNKDAVGVVVGVSSNDDVFYQPYDMGSLGWLDGHTGAHVGSLVDLSGTSAAGYPVHFDELDGHMVIATGLTGLIDVEGRGEARWTSALQGQAVIDRSGDVLALTGDRLVHLRRADGTTADERHVCDGEVLTTDYLLDSSGGQTWAVPLP